MNGGGTKPRGLFVNTEQANCSIYESGLMVYRALRAGNAWDLDYVEIHQLDIAALHSQKLIAIGAASGTILAAENYDFWVFNYHHSTMRDMARLDSAQLGKLPGKKYCIVLEVARNDAFVHAPRGHFDGYLVLEPSIDEQDPSAHPFPRPLEFFDLGKNPGTGDDPELPIIGSFGFATPGKGFEIVVDAVNREFDRAIIRLNIPPGTYADSYFFKLHGRNYAEYLGDLCRNVAKPGIHVRVSHHFMTKDELVVWCAQNSLNCFMYTRNQPGLSATTDQAIASGRPLSVSTNDTFRHLHRYIPPYPYRSLQESLALSRPEVLQMRRAWAPEQNTERFTQILIADGVLPYRPFQQPFPIPQRLNDRIRSFQNPKILNLDLRSADVFFEGVGQHIAEMAALSARFRFAHEACLDLRYLRDILTKHRDAAAILLDVTPEIDAAEVAAILRAIVTPNIILWWHGAQAELIKSPLYALATAIFCSGEVGSDDPKQFYAGRMVPYVTNVQLPPDNLMRIGTVLVSAEKDPLQSVVALAARDFAQAEIALLPLVPAQDQRGLAAMIETARADAQRQGIILKLRDMPKSRQELSFFLATNSINVFVHGDRHDERLARCTDVALSVQQPLAMIGGGFACMFEKSALHLSRRGLKETAQSDVSAQAPFLNEWSPGRFMMRLENSLEQVLDLERGAFRIENSAR